MVPYLFIFLPITRYMFTFYLTLTLSSLFEGYHKDFLTMASNTSFDSYVMLFGFHYHTAVWSARVRQATGELAGWVQFPAKNLVTLEDSLSQFPKLEVLVIDVFNEVLKDLDPLCIDSSLTAVLSDFYNYIEKAMVLLPGIRVSFDL